MTFFEELKRRGLVAQTTHEDKIQDLIDNHSILDSMQQQIVCMLATLSS